MAISAVNVKSSPDQVRRKSRLAPGPAREPKAYLARIVYVAALLALTVAIVAGLSVDKLMAGHTMNFPQALAEAVQFGGDPIFLAP